MYVSMSNENSWTLTLRILLKSLKCIFSCDKYRSCSACNHIFLLYTNIILADCLVNELQNSFVRAIRVNLIKKKTEF